jgi:hypothetical protein
MKDNQNSGSDTFDETPKPNKVPTEAELMEIRSLYAQADAMAEAAEKAETSGGDGQSSDTPPPTVPSHQGDERGDAG